MHTKTLLFSFLILTLLCCTKQVNYSPEHIKETSGRYLYSQEEVIDVYYDNNQLFLKWKGGLIKPVAFDEHSFFVADMYKKLRFVKHPESKKSYLGIVSERDDAKVDFAYLKVEDTFKTPLMYVRNKQYDKAIAGYLEIKKQDSTSVFLNEQEFNRLGYELLRKKDYHNAVEVFKMNVTLFPESDNVYDSLADTFLRQGDSIQAFENYKKALVLNSGNERAKAFVKAYETKGK